MGSSRSGSWFGTASPRLTGRPRELAVDLVILAGRPRVGVMMPFITAVFDVACWLAVGRQVDEGIP